MQIKHVLQDVLELLPHAALFVLGKVAVHVGQQGFDFGDGLCFNAELYAVFFSATVSSWPSASNSSLTFSNEPILSP